MPNEMSELDQSTSAVGRYLSCLFKFNRILCLTNGGDPDQTANHVASDMDQHCIRAG